VFLRQRAEPVHVVRGLGRGEYVVQLGEPGDEAFEAGAEGELQGSNDGGIEANARGDGDSDDRGRRRQGSESRL
jgi:hypothetical protein